MLHLLKKTAAAAKPRAQNLQTRLMSGGHGHGGPPPTGFEAKVRAVLPKDYQVRRPLANSSTSLSARSSTVPHVMGVGRMNAVAHAMREEYCSS
jgi:hypothetical protein